MSRSNCPNVLAPLNLTDSLAKILQNFVTVTALPLMLSLSLFIKPRETSVLSCKESNQICFNVLAKFGVVLTHSVSDPYLYLCVWNCDKKLCDPVSMIVKSSRSVTLADVNYRREVFSIVDRYISL